jgi:NADPH:quinone reductase-like Zn-dependent oxidoreductase
VLKPGGILVSLVQQPSQETADSYGVRQAMVYTSPPIGKTLTEIAALVDSGRIKPQVAAVLPLEAIQKAHDMVAGKHTVGKIVLEITR